MRTRRATAVPAGFLALVATVLVLAGIVGLELRGGTGLSAPTTRDAASRSTVTPQAGVPGQPADDRTDGRVATILGRPLFSPTRRPDEAANEGAPGGMARLTGVTVSPIGKAAIFAAPAGGKPIVIGEGARIGAYVVGSIEAGAVTVIGPEGQRVLHPTFDLNAPSKPVASPPPGQTARPPSAK
jgi:hypothetical protein